MNLAINAWVGDLSDDIFRTLVTENTLAWSFNHGIFVAGLAEWGCTCFSVYYRSTKNAKIRGITKGPQEGRNPGSRNE